MSKILLVEDDNNLREIFEMRLQAEGFNTVTASDGEQALGVAMKEKPELIIADVMMPKLSGFQMLETLRASPEMAKTKVVMMTALGQAEDKARGEKLGVVKYLVKSQVTLEDFVRVVREVLQSDQAAAPQAAVQPTDYNSTNNKQESENSMQDDNTQSSSPSMPPADGSTPPANPVSGTPNQDMGDTSGQMSTKEEQNKVDEQINTFTASAPGSTGSADQSSMPSPGGSNMGAGSDSSMTGAEGTSTTSSPSSDMPATTPPGDSSSMGGDQSSPPAGDNPTGPSSPPSGAPQV